MQERNILGSNLNEASARLSKSPSKQATLTKPTCVVIIVNFLGFALELEGRALG